MASAIAVKNTFLQIGGQAPLNIVQSVRPRPRGETFDVSLLAMNRQSPYQTKTTTSSHEPVSDDDESSNSESEGNTTIMLRNIPNKYTQKMLLEVIEEEFEGLFNFFYLPIDFKNKCNVGYAFLNFIEPYYCKLGAQLRASLGELFWKKFSGRRLTGFKSKKVCDVSWGRVQGLKNNLEHYRNSSIMNLSCHEYKPLLFKNGQAVPFPPPKKSSGSNTRAAATDKDVD